MNILIVTWNMCGGQGPARFEHLLSPEKLDIVPEIYAIGIQESPGVASSTELRDLVVSFQASIGPNHVLLHSASLGVLSLSIFVRRDLIWYVSVPEDDFYNLRTKPTNIIKTKGAICISFALFGTTFLFVNSHLSAHIDKNQERLNEYDRICRSINLPQNLKPLKPMYISNDLTSRFDCVFWFGDLNFRIEQRYSDALKMLTRFVDLKKREKFTNSIRVVNRASLSSFEMLMNDDQLSKALNKGDIFHGFQEAKIRFPPTYKYRIGSDCFDILGKRVPSYTDRILFRCKRSDLKCQIYDSVQRVNTSDHKPVYALMNAKLRPGRDDIPLNAGLFKRDIYLDGLKRRLGEKGTEKGHQSLICILS